MSYSETLEVMLARQPVTVPLATVTGGVVLYGYSVRETTGTATATIDIYDGTDNTGLRAIPITLIANESTEDWFGPQGVLLRGGMFVVTSGAVAGSLFVCTDWE